MNTGRIQREDEAVNRQLVRNMQDAQYEALGAFWPNQPGGTPMVDYLNSVLKYGVCETLKEALELNNSTLIKGNVAEGSPRTSQRHGQLRATEEG
jgi:hypothetical protein